jgi:hypothetical protein
MPQNRIPLKSYRYSPQGKRKIGKPKKTQVGQILLKENKSRKYESK